MIAPGLGREAGKWPSFVQAAERAGFTSVHALPMRLRDIRLGTLGLFGSGAGSLPAADLRLAQALAHVASVALVADRASTDQAAISEQLQAAVSTAR